MDFTVLISHEIPLDGMERLKDGARLIYPEGKGAFSDQELMEYLPLADAMICAGHLRGEMLKQAPGLKIIVCYGAGYEKIDLKAASARRIPVANIPDSTAQATAELAMGLMLSVRRKIARLDRDMRGSERLSGLFEMGHNMGNTLEGARLGIIGMGHIGRKLKDMARAMGMKVSYYNRRPLPPALSDLAAYRPLEELLAESDVVSIHCPLNQDSASLINAERLTLMKPGAVLINTARGGVVDMEALIEALSTGRLMGAGLDVYPDEPHVDGRLLKMPNVVLTPHIGANTVETRVKMAQACQARILDALSGRRPANVVNPEIYG